TLGHLFQVTCTATCGSFVWADKSGNLPDIPVDSVIVNPNYPQQVFAGTDFGLYFTNDITAATPSWYRFNNGLPAVMIWDMQIDRGSTTLSLWTRGRGAFVWPLSFAAINTPPTIAAVGVTRQAGTAVSSSTIANVTDLESGNGGVTVTVNGGSSATVNGVTVSSIVNVAGAVNA